jgi:hypothetical protein
MAKTAFQIKINPTTWKKYQGEKNRRGYQCIMLSERFLQDPKIQQLTASQVLLYLSCLLHASQSTPGECQVNAQLMSSECRVKPGLIPSGLQALQSLQLLTYEKIEPLKKLREGNRREEKVIPLVPSVLVPKPADPPNPRRAEPEKQTELIATEPALATGVADRLVRLWNSNRGSLPECKSLGNDRRKKATLRWREHPDEAFWVSLAQFLAKSDWHQGKNDRGWRADFDFFVQAKTCLKFREGTLGGQQQRASRPIFNLETGEML